MKPRILLSLPQMPQDPASGAARNAQTAVEFAQESGFEVRAIGTTATERGQKQDALSYIKSLGVEVEVTPPGPRNRREYRFTQRGIPYTLLDTGRLSPLQWEQAHGRQFDLLFDRELETFQPDILFTYGGLPGDIRRHRRAKLSGAKIAFCVFNMGYLVEGFFDHIDVVTTPSEFMAQRYKEAIGIDSVALPTPLDLDDVLAPEHDPIFVTMVNPSVEKGLFFFVRLAEEAGKRCPNIALLAIESRGTAGMVLKAGLMGGFDLRRHENIMIAGAVPKPRDIFANTRMLLVPSCWEEPSGRVVAEAMVNGVPPLVSDRGGLAESCNGAGYVLPLPPDYTMQTRRPVAAEAVEPWLNVVQKLCFDEELYEQQVTLCREAAAMYSRNSLKPRYLELFEKAIQGTARLRPWKTQFTR
ncbi:MAG: glycosyltransferase [Bryobacterales bacterium]|nr:glycosyltransferase [Bryobacterales bacterium]